MLQYKSERVRSSKFKAEVTMEKWMLKIWTISQWTLAGILSAYTVTALYSFTLMLLPKYLLGLPISPWIIQMVIGGAIGGFIAGLAKAGFVEMVDYWRS